MSRLHSKPPKQETRVLYNRPSDLICAAGLLERDLGTWIKALGKGILAGTLLWGLTIAEAKLLKHHGKNPFLRNHEYSDYYYKYEDRNNDGIQDKITVGYQPYQKKWEECNIRYGIMSSAGRTIYVPKDWLSKYQKRV